MIHVGRLSSPRSLVSSLRPPTCTGACHVHGVKGVSLIHVHTREGVAAAARGAAAVAVHLADIHEHTPLLVLQTDSVPPRAADARDAWEEPESCNVACSMSRRAKGEGVGVGAGGSGSGWEWEERGDEGRRLDWGGAEWRIGQGRGPPGGCERWIESVKAGV